MNGWIKLHRKIQNHPAYFAEPFTKMGAWIDLLLLANHDEGAFVVKGKKVTVARGQIGYSQETLAQRWRWSRGKVIRYLNELETVHQIVQIKTSVITLISIVNYEYHQGDGTDDDTQTDPKSVHRSVHKQEERRKKKEESLNTGAGDQVKTATGKKKTPGPRDLVVPLGFDDRFQDLWRAYRQYRVAERKGWFKDPRSEQSAIDQFWDICGGDFVTAEEIIKKTISNRWTGLFPIKNQQSKNGTITTEGRQSGTVGKAASTIGGIISTSDF